MERQRLAGNPDTDPSVLMSLSFDESWRVRSACASNPKVPGPVLRRLAGDAHARVRKAAARHPALPDDLIMTLAGDQSPVVRGRIAVRRAVGTDGILAANLARSPRAELRRMAAGSAATPPAGLDGLVSDSDVGVRMAVAANPGVSDEVADQLAVDADASVRAAVAGRPRLSAVAVDRLSRDPVAAVRVALAANPACSHSVLRRMARRSWREPDVLRAMAANVAAPAGLLRRLAGRRWDVACVVAANPSCPSPLLEGAYLAGSQILSIRMTVAARAAGPSWLLVRFARDYAPVRLLLATNPALDPDLVERLLADTDPFVQGVAAAHRAAPLEALDRLAGGLSAPAWTLRAIAANPACRPDLADQLLTWLALGGAGGADPNFDPVACSGHPGEVGTNPYLWYRQEAANSSHAGNASGPLRHPLWRVRAAIPSSRKSTPYTRLAEMARDIRPEVRQVASGYPGLSASVLNELSGDAVPSVARQAAASLKRKAEQPITKLTKAKRRQRRVVIAILATAYGLVLAGRVGLIPIHGSTPTTIPPLGPGLASGATGGPAQVLPGGATLIAGTGVLNLPSINITTGDRGLTVTIPQSILDPLGADGNYRIPARSAHTFLLLPVLFDRTVTVTVKPDGADPVKVTVDLPVATP